MKILIDLEVYRKMFGYIKAANGEISGLAKVIRDPADLGTFHIVDIALFHQVCTAASTDIQEDSLAQFADEMIQKKEDLGLWCCWWHSHANMATFWSNTDTSTIESLSPESMTNNFIVSMVGNKKNELLCRIDSFDPLRATQDKVQFEINYGDETLDEECQKEVDEKVVDSRPVQTIVRQTSIPMTAGEIAAAEGKKQMEEAENIFTAEELGITHKGNYHVTSSGVYYFKQGFWHKKLEPLSKKEQKKVNEAYDAEQKEYEEMEAQYYRDHPEEKKADLESGFIVEQNGVIRSVLQKEEHDYDY